MEPIPLNSGLRETIELAQRAAARRGLMHATPEFLLEAMLTRPQSLPAAILAGLNIPLDDLHIELLRHLRALSQPVAIDPRMACLDGAAQACIDRSREIAADLGNPLVGQTHVLLALIEAPSSVSGALLAASGVTFDKVRQAFIECTRKDDALRVRSPHSSSPPPMPPPPLSDHVREIIRDAPKMARLWRQAHYGPEHILAALLHRGRGTAIDLLRRCGVDLIAISQELEKRMPIGDDLPEAHPAPAPVLQTLEAAAQQAGSLLQQPAADTEHLLLALASVESLASQVLLQFNVDPSALKVQLTSFGQRWPEILPLVIPEPRSVIDKTAYTPGMREILKLSKVEAGRLGHDFIGVPHYLLAILRKGDGLAIQTMSNLGVDLEELRSVIEQAIPIGKGPTVGLFSPNQGARRAIDLAKETALQMRHGWVGSEHLLLGIMLGQEPATKAALDDAGLEFEAVKREILAVINGSTPVPVPVPDVTRIAMLVDVSHLPSAADISLPQYATADSAGADLRAAVAENTELVIDPGKWGMVPTGLKIAIPPGYEGQVRARSGLAAKHGIGILNGPGTIDADFRGEINVILFNFSDKPFIIKRGDRIAQLVVNRVQRVEWREVADLSETGRGAGGFGHTGSS